MDLIYESERTIGLRIPYRMTPLGLIPNPYQDPYGSSEEDPRWS
jgi:hypothetical protein